MSNTNQELKKGDQVIKNETPDTLKDQYFDLRGLSAYSSMKVSTLRDHIRRGMPAYKVRGKILVKMSEFDKWFEGYRINRDQDLSLLVDKVMKDLED